MSFNPKLLEMLSNSGNQSSEQSMLSLLEGQDSLSPRAKMLIQMMTAGNQEADKEHYSDDVHDDDQRDDQATLVAEIHHLKDELLEAQEMIDVMADAVGACASCFGGNDDCPECRGRGTAGWRRPDPELFAHFIIPAVKRVKSHRTRKNTIRADESEFINSETVQRPTSIDTKGESNV